jgi:glycosyltransferase involved in cell wall biosynthesis
VDADLVICSSSGWAHAVRTSGRKVVYCHSPARWLYQSGRYVGHHGWLRRASMWPAIGALRGPLRLWDRRAAHRADLYLANSSFVQDEVRRLYGIEARVVHPPTRDLATSPRRRVRGLEPGFLLCVSRLLPYKNVDLLVDAMRLLPEQRLVVAGSGPEAARLTAMAPANVRLLGTVSDEELAWLYGSCSAVVAASHEDFGLVPIEAAFFAKPTAALRGGGFLDTVVDGETGILFDRLEPESIAQAAVEAMNLSTPPGRMIAHAHRFSEESFARELRAAGAGRLATLTAGSRVMPLASSHEGRA